MGGKSKASNTASVMMEQQAAQEARAKEEARKARVQQGLKSIEELYEGAPVFGNRSVALDFSGLDVGKDVGGYKARRTQGPVIGGGVPIGGGGGGGGGGAASAATGPYSAAQAAFAPYQPDTTKGEAYLTANAPWYKSANYNAAQETFGPQPAGGQSFDDSSNTWVTGQNPRASTGGFTPIQYGEGEYELVDANGNVVARGKNLSDIRGFKASRNESYDTGKKTGGIGQDFYDKFRNAQIDYYMPQLETQYGEAKDNLIADLARSGQSISSLKGEKFGKLDAQNLTNRASITSKADVATGELKQRVAAEKKALIDQLYATEDPDIAASQALSRVNAAKMTTPDLTSLGRMFDLGTIGQNAYAGARDTAYATGIQGGAYTPRPAGAGSGKVYA